MNHGAWTRLERVSIDSVPLAAAIEANADALLGEWTASAAQLVARAARSEHQNGARAYSLPVPCELLPVEEPLLEDRIAKMDAALAPGLTKE